MALPDNLDTGALLRTRAHSNAVAENLELGQAWDDFGIVADIVVRIEYLVYCRFGIFLSNLNLNFSRYNYMTEVMHDDTYSNKSWRIVVLGMFTLHTKVCIYLKFILSSHRVIARYTRNHNPHQQIIVKNYRSIVCLADTCHHR